jgi:hypothetical protein
MEDETMTLSLCKVLTDALLYLIAMFVAQILNNLIMLFIYAAIFTSRLEDCLLPGPMAYVTHSDAFITCTLALNIKSYKYKMLATSTVNSISTALSTKEAT